jgi:FMN phosphatase YigB (HAD superfamily)
MNVRRMLLWALLIVSLGLIAASVASAADDPLPSWNEGAAKRAIMDFVTRVTTPGGTDLVPAQQRIVTFDNDGTLWAEQAIYFQFAFVFDRIKALAPQHPEWKTKQPYQAVLEGDMGALAAAGEQGVLELMAVTHTGMTTVEFFTIVSDWTATAQHPRFKRPYIECVYQPMLELLAYLRATGFKTFIVSGGGVEFMRVFAERVYGIPPKHVSLDAILLSLKKKGSETKGVALKNDPPVIFYSAKPANLVVFDGDPVMSPVHGTSLLFAVNTNWDEFLDPSTSTYYLLDGAFWLSAPNYTEPWKPVAQLPAVFNDLPNDKNFEAVKEDIPGIVVQEKDMPVIFVSTTPTEIILTKGPRRSARSVGRSSCT